MKTKRCGDASNRSAVCGIQLRYSLTKSWMILTGARQSGRAAKRDASENLPMKRLKPIESLILTIRGPKVLVDADLASRWKPAPSIRKKVDKYIKDTYLKKVQAPQGRETNAKSMDGAFV